MWCFKTWPFPSKNKYYILVALWLVNIIVKVVLFMFGMFFSYFLFPFSIVKKECFFFIFLLTLEWVWNYRMILKICSMKLVFVWMGCERNVTEEFFLYKFLLEESIIHFQPSLSFYRCHFSFFVGNRYSMRSTANWRGYYAMWNLVYRVLLKIYTTSSMEYTVCKLVNAEYSSCKRQIWSVDEI